MPAYDTPTGAQGTGAARTQAEWAIIPLCGHCHDDSHGAKKRLNLFLAFRVRDYLYPSESLSPEISAHYARLSAEFPASENAVAFGRAMEWARWLLNAKRGILR